MRETVNGRLRVALVVALALFGLAVLAAANGQAALAAPAGTVITNCTQAGLESALAGGGAITFNCGGPATITDTTPINISQDAALDGGDAVTLTGNFATRLFIVNSGVTFTLAHIVLEGAASTGGDGGAIVNHGHLTLDHATIAHSQTDSSHSGGALFSDGPLTITNSTLNNNASGSAGALFANFSQAIVHVSNSTFNGNATVNTATGFGGAIWVGQGAQVTVAGGAISNNKAQFGGGVYITQGGFFTVTASGAPALIQGNTASFAGGGIYNSIASAALTNVALRGNSALNADPFVETFGGGIDAFQGTTTLSAASLLSNTANTGGGIFVISGTLTVTSTQLISNTAEPDDGGGLEVAGGGSVTLTNSVFQHNRAGNGGGIGDAASGQALSLYATSFISNTADVEGGGLYSTGLVYVETALFSDNAAVMGGGLGLFHTALTATGLTLDNNYAAEAGGGGDISGGVVTLYGPAVTNNHVGTSGSGGGLHIEGSDVMTYYPVISGNHVAGTGQGGGIDLVQSYWSSLDLLLSDNRVDSGFGGGLRAAQSSFTVYGAAIRDNSAGTGGAIENDTSTTIVVSGTLSGNLAGANGGALWLRGGSAYLAGDTFGANQAGPAHSTGGAPRSPSSVGLGGAVLISSGLLTATNTTFSGNLAALAGGGVYNAAGAASLSNVTLSGNSSPAGGGLDNPSPLVTETITLSNTLIAAGSQGANCTAASGIISKGYNLSSDNTCAAFFNQTGDLNNVNPRLGPLAANGGPTLTHLPGAGSPAIDAIPFGMAGCGTSFTRDQRGAPRPLPSGGRCDIGAVEANAVLPLLWLPLTRR